MREAHASTAIFSFVANAASAFNTRTPIHMARTGETKMSPRRLHHSVRTIDLDRDQLMVFSDPAGTCIEVLFGGLWLTEERCAQDRIASTGQALRLHGNGRAVAESFGPTRLRVSAPARLGSALRSAWQRWRPALAALAPRSMAALLALLLSVSLPEVLGRAVQQRLEIAQQRVALAASHRPPAFDRVSVVQPRHASS
jgi:hypothetical protein